jgi:hypothetical protein
MDVQLHPDVSLRTRIPRFARIRSGVAERASDSNEYQETKDQRGCSKSQVIASEIRCNQIIRASASANIESGRGGAYQIAVAIERVQESRFVGANIRLNTLQCSGLDIE